SVSRPSAPYRERLVPHGSLIVPHRSAFVPNPLFPRSGARDTTPPGVARRQRSARGAPVVLSRGGTYAKLLVSVRRPCHPCVCRGGGGTTNRPRGRDHRQGRQRGRRTVAVRQRVPQGPEGGRRHVDRR